MEWLAAPAPQPSSGNDPNRMIESDKAQKPGASRGAKTAMQLLRLPDVGLHGKTYGGLEKAPAGDTSAGVLLLRNAQARLTLCYHFFSRLND